MRQRSRKLDRKAVTLIEVLLVLALLVTLAAMTWPALDRPMANQTLRKAADKVRTSWAKARVDAMSTGNTNVFRCTAEDGKYTIEAQAGPESVDSITSSMEGEFDETASGAATTDALSSRTYDLPEGIRFVAAEVDFDTRATILGQATDGTTEMSTGDSIDPILFFPDGTTSTAKLTLENQYQRRIELTVRGLTGAMAVGDTYAGEDATNASQY
jgi:Tfp pilus assembly protein FimT